MDKSKLTTVAAVIEDCLANNYEQGTHTATAWMQCGGAILKAACNLSTDRKRVAVISDPNGVFFDAEEAIEEAVSLDNVRHLLTLKEPNSLTR